MLEKESVIRMSGNSVSIIIPANVWKDSSNKFKLGQKITVKLSSSGKEFRITEK